MESKSMDWLLYDNGLCHERVYKSSSTFIDVNRHDGITVRSA